MEVTAVSIIGDVRLRCSGCGLGPNSTPRFPEFFSAERGRITRLGVKIKVITVVTAVNSIGDVRT